MNTLDLHFGIHDLRRERPIIIQKEEENRYKPFIEFSYIKFINESEKNK
ncbi:MAG: hypothetical protein ACFFB0_15780 [Promethearchaeota archaeon]